MLGSDGNEGAIILTWSQRLLFMNVNHAIKKGEHSKEQRQTKKICVLKKTQFNKA